jgi:hypothetical protein
MNRKPGYFAESTSASSMPRIRLAMILVPPQRLGILTSAAAKSSRA